MTDFVIKQNDTSPVIIANLQDEEGNPVDISSSDVQFHMAKYNGQNIINSPAVILDSTDGKVKYEWQTGDTSQKGTFQAEFQVTFADGSIETFPNSGYVIVKIVGELA